MDTRAARGHAGRRLLRLARPRGNNRARRRGGRDAYFSSMLLIAVRLIRLHSIIWNRAGLRLASRSAPSERTSLSHAAGPLMGEPILLHRGFLGRAAMHAERHTHQTGISVPHICVQLTCAGIMFYVKADSIRARALHICVISRMRISLPPPNFSRP